MPPGAGPGIGPVGSWPKLWPKNSRSNSSVLAHERSLLRRKLGQTKTTRDESLNHRAARPLSHTLASALLRRPASCLRRSGLPPLARRRRRRLLRGCSSGRRLGVAPGPFPCPPSPSCSPPSASPLPVFPLSSARDLADALAPHPWAAACGLPKPRAALARRQDRRSQEPSVRLSLRGCGEPPLYRSLKLST